MNSEHLKYLSVFSFPKKIRLGNNFDGGYVIASDIGNYDCYISAGIGNDESFSNDFLQLYKVKNTAAFQLDIETLPKNYPVEMVHYKRNISNISDNKNANLSYFTKNYDNIFLKMDIEGGEYLWLDYVSVNDLKKFKQLVIEFHGINDDTWDYNYQTKVDIFKKLSETHYLVHAHGNNFSDTQLLNNVSIPDVIELTFIRKEFLENPVLNTEKLPMNIDYPNNLEKETDIDLNFPPFVNNKVENISIHSICNNEKNDDNHLNDKNNIVNDDNDNYDSDDDYDDDGNDVDDDDGNDVDDDDDDDNDDDDDDFDDELENIIGTTI